MWKLEPWFISGLGRSVLTLGPDISEVFSHLNDSTMRELDGKDPYILWCKCSLHTHLNTVLLKKSYTSMHCIKGGPVFPSYIFWVLAALPKQNQICCKAFFLKKNTQTTKTGVFIQEMVIQIIYICIYIFIINFY